MNNKRPQLTTLHTEQERRQYYFELCWVADFFEHYKNPEAALTAVRWILSQRKWERDDSEEEAAEVEC